MASAITSLHTPAGIVKLDTLPVLMLVLAMLYWLTRTLLSRRVPT